MFKQSFECEHEIVRYIPARLCQLLVAADRAAMRIDPFMRELGRANELDLTKVVMSDARAEAGRIAFRSVDRCSACCANLTELNPSGGLGDGRFNASPAGQAAGRIPLTTEQIDDIGRFLCGISAAFNAQLALKRLDAARALARRFGNQHIYMQREMLRLANVEVSDTLEVLLSQPQLNVESQRELLRAHSRIEAARGAPSPAIRLAAIRAARDAVALGSSKLGTNLAFAMGEGTVLS